MNSLWLLQHSVTCYLKANVFALLIISIKYPKVVKSALLRRKKIDFTLKEKMMIGISSQSANKKTTRKPFYEILWIYNFSTTFYSSDMCFNFFYLILNWKNYIHFNFIKNVRKLREKNKRLINAQPNRSRWGVAFFKCLFLSVLFALYIFLGGLGLI